ncbi:GNAT family N-acetyltransferase [Roseicyclus marinus]|uniref:GNAT family N-acetyltransferase n=1 Tax=Roseicyclus marinus TaxID=2161673 RepID=UPI00240F8E87|nr:GNAT family N-acetyltransferase [Roseicyclus marinus]MDG3043017.1 GNAT family N-acetyltransferase [Roseicyclus marinus]
MSLTLRAFRGAEIAPMVEPFAHLRIAVFRDWPYLYDGDLDYERRYLADYARSDSILVAAFDGDRLVGGSTGLPLSDHSEVAADLADMLPTNAKNVYYCAESVLLSSHRGQGAYRGFFDLREAHARSLDATFSIFCAVIRPKDHPLRPKDAQPLDPVWRHFGYAPLPGVTTTISWRALGEAAESPKPLQVWIKRL